jgi:hypothetical protein
VGRLIIFVLKKTATNPFTSPNEILLQLPALIPGERLVLVRRK